jgi:hypothetical protein
MNTLRESRGFAITGVASKFNLRNSKGGAGGILVIAGSESDLQRVYNLLFPNEKVRFYASRTRDATVIVLNQRDGRPCKETEPPPNTAQREDGK